MRGSAQATRDCEHALGDFVGALVVGALVVGLAVGAAVGAAVGLAVGDAVTVLPQTNPGLYCAAVFHACVLIGVLHRALLATAGCWLALPVYEHRPSHRVFTDDQPLGK